MTVRSNRLALKTVSAAGTTLLYTAPASTRVIVKDATIYSDAAAPGRLAVLLFDVGGTDGGVLINVAAAARQTVYRFSGGALVMRAGDTLSAIVGSITGGVSYVAIGGSELAL